MVQHQWLLGKRAVKHVTEVMKKHPITRCHTITSSKTQAQMIITFDPSVEIVNKRTKKKTEQLKEHVGDGSDRQDG